MAQAAPRQTFSSVLDTPAGDIERPKPVPVGSYVTVIQGQARIDTSKKKQTEFSEYTHKFLEALDDVDEDALATFLTNKDGTKKKLQDVTMKNTYYHTENSLYRLKEFFEHCGIDMDDEGSLRQYMAETPGKQVVVHVTHQASDDGSAVYARITSTTAVE